MLFILLGFKQKFINLYVDIYIHTYIYINILWCWGKWIHPLYIFRYFLDSGFNSQPHIFSPKCHLWVECGPTLTDIRMNPSYTWMHGSTAHSAVLVFTYDFQSGKIWQLFGGESPISPWINQQNWFPNTFKGKNWPCSCAILFCWLVQLFIEF